MFLVSHQLGFEDCSPSDKSMRAVCGEGGTDFGREGGGENWVYQSVKRMLII